MADVVKVGLMGLGTVGRGVLQVLQRNRSVIAARSGREIKVTKILVSDVKKHAGESLDGAQLTTSADDLLLDKDISIIIEVMGGTDKALDYILRAMEQGKQVVTANKALIALHGATLFDKARQAQTMLVFEAAVGGGIPIIKTLREGLGGNNIQWLAGIINGTSNFILTMMLTQGMTFTAALELAQRKGYAEANPSFDVDGIDAAHKLAILSAIAFGTELQYEKIHCSGLRDLDIKDIDYAQKLGYCVKLIAFARASAEGIEACVSPMLVSNETLLAHVNGVMNAIWVQSDAVGPSLYYGAGAGSEATASAVIADLVDVVRNQAVPLEQRVPYLAFKTLENKPYLDQNDFHSGFYLRFEVKDEPGVLAAITKILAEGHISILSMSQPQTEAGAVSVPLIMLTHSCKEGDLLKACKLIEQSKVSLSPATVMRICSL